MVIVIFIFGLIVGSFLNAAIHRLHTGQSIVMDSSRCPHCNHKLGAADLIPLISFFILRGKCRYCGKKISWQYPAVELVTAIAFVLVYLNAKVDWISSGKFLISNFQFLTWEVFFQLIFSCFLIIIFVYDFKHYLILDKIVFPAAALALVYSLWQGNALNALLGALVLAGFFALLYFVSKGRWIGFGDVKLGIFLGFLIPWPSVLIVFFFAYFFGATVGIMLLAYGSKSLQSRLPFGTFLTVAAFVAMLWGQDIMSWYLKLIGM